MTDLPAPLLGVDPGFEFEELEDIDLSCQGCCVDEFCGANCDYDVPHVGACLCNYHQWVAAGCP